MQDSVRVDSTIDTQSDRRRAQVESGVGTTRPITNDRDRRRSQRFLPTKFVIFETKGKKIDVKDIMLLLRNKELGSTNPVHSPILLCFLKVHREALCPNVHNSDGL